MKRTIKEYLDELNRITNEAVMVNSKKPQMAEIKEMKVIKDGNAWMFVFPDFTNLQESPSVWVETDKGNADISVIYELLCNARDKAKEAANG